MSAQHKHGAHLQGGCCEGLSMNEEKQEECGRSDRLLYGGGVGRDELSRFWLAGTCLEIKQNSAAFLLKIRRQNLRSHSDYAY